jgi:hypothetical protein
MKWERCLELQNKHDNSYSMSVWGAQVLHIAQHEVLRETVKKPLYVVKETEKCVVKYKVVQIWPGLICV